MQPIERTQAYITGGMVVCAFVVLATIIVVQIVKPWFRVRLQRRLINGWIGGMYPDNWDRANRDLFEYRSEPPKWLVGLVRSERVRHELNKIVMDAVGNSTNRYEAQRRSGSPMVDNAMRMRLMQNQAIAQLEAPLRDPHYFLQLTEGASDQDRMTALYLDALRRTDPALLAKITEIRDETEGREIALVIAGIRGNLVAIAERNLDTLQLRLHSAWEREGKLIALVLGVVIAILLGIGVRIISPGFLGTLLLGPSILAGAIGVVAGLTWFEHKIPWLIPDWAMMTLSGAAILIWLAFSIWAGVAAAREGWITGPGDGADMLVIGLIGGGVAPVVYDAIQSLFNRRG